MSVFGDTQAAVGGHGVVGNVLVERPRRRGACTRVAQDLVGSAGLPDLPALRSRYTDNTQPPVTTA